MCVFFYTVGVGVCAILVGFPFLDEPSNAWDVEIKPFTLDDYGNKFPSFGFLSGKFALKAILACVTFLFEGFSRFGNSVMLLVGCPWFWLEP